jgi:uncharacterized protein YpmS
MARRKKKIKFSFWPWLLSLILLAISISLLFVKNFQISTEKPTNITNFTNVTTTIPFANENISIEVPPGVVRIEKGGRIKTT